MKTRLGPLVLTATYWGQERNRSFSILVDGVVIAKDRLAGDGGGDFIDRN